MKMLLYSVRDRVANQFIGGVMVFANDAVAVRVFADVAKDSNSVIGGHVADHDLLCVGEFHHEYGVAARGEVVEYEGRNFFVPRVVLTGEAFVASQSRGPEIVQGEARAS